MPGGWEWIYEPTCPCCEEPDCENCKMTDESEYPIGSYDYDDDMLPFNEFQEKWGDI